MRVILSTADIIKSSLIAKAIEDAYHGFMMQHKYPFVVLSLSVDGRLVDVNVHPNKMELRFSNGEQLYTRLAGLIAETLRNRELITNVSVKEEKKTEQKPVYDKKEIPEPFESRRREQMEKQDASPFSADVLQKIRQSVRQDSPYEKKYEADSSRHGTEPQKYPAAQKPEEEKPAPTDMPLQKIRPEDIQKGRIRRQIRSVRKSATGIRRCRPPSPTIWQKRRSFSPGRPDPGIGSSASFLIPTGWWSTRINFT